MRFKNTKNYYIFLVLLNFSLFLTSCITSKKLNYLQEPSNTIPAYDNKIGYKEYTLAPFDKLYIKVYSPKEEINRFLNGSSQSFNQQGEGAMSDLYAYTIDKNGKINFPVIGKIRLDGLYIREAKRVIERAIKTYIIDDCAVDIKLVGRYFSVIGGDVNGRFPIAKEKMNIFQAIAMAGGIGTFGDRSNVRILRESPQGVQIKSFDVRSKDIINSEYYYIQPNDVIYIEEVNSRFFSVTNIGAAFSTFTTTLSFGLFIYNLVTPDKESTDSSENSNSN